MNTQDDSPNDDQPVLSDPEDAPAQEDDLDGHGLVPPSAADVGVEHGERPGDESGLPTMLDADLLGGPK